MRAILEQRENGLVAIWTFSARNILDRNNSQDFPKRGHSRAKFFDGIFLHQPHPVRPPRFANLFGISGRPNQGADGFIQVEEFIGSDPALVTCVVAYFAADRNSHGGGRCGNADLGESRLKFRTRTLDGMAAAKFSDQALSHYASH